MGVCGYGGGGISIQVPGASFGPSRARGVRHPFQGILRLTLLGLVCGQTAMAQFALFARVLWPALKEPLGFSRDHPPPATTISLALGGGLA